MTEDLLSQLKQYTTIVADTGDFQEIYKYKPIDATTNPSLILQSAKDPKYAHLINEALSLANQESLSPKEKTNKALDYLFVLFGREILNIVPGRVSVEVDARLSFSITQSVEKAKKLIKLFEKRKIPRERILIKLASTWEGIEAAKLLERENIHCNMTLLFSLAQAIYCAEAKATLISPFVGRILDWYKVQHNRDYFPPEEDPGVLSVQKIYNYFKKFDYPTQIMGASFRNSEEILALSGCDLLTISPKLLDELQQTQGNLLPQLNKETAKRLNLTKEEKCDCSNANYFHFALKNDPMAFTKLHEGIEKFSKDIQELEKIIAK